jgi:hypothetical protein
MEEFKKISGYAFVDEKCFVNVNTGEIGADPLRYMLKMKSSDTTIPDLEVQLIINMLSVLLGQPQFSGVVRCEILHSPSLKDLTGKLCKLRIFLKEGSMTLEVACHVMSIVKPEIDGYYPFKA